MLTWTSTLQGPSQKKIPKRLRNDEDEGQEVTPKRVRQIPEFEDEVGRGMFDDDAGVNMMEDSSVGEIGRDAASALPDAPSSALMPWNLSQSLHSHQRGASSSIHGRGLGSQTQRRLTSASPLLGRGSNLPGVMDQFELMDEDPIIYGRDDHEGASFELP